MYANQDIAWVDCSPSRWPYGIFGANFGTKNVEEKVISIRDQIRQGNAPHLWMTGPAMNPRNLEEHLVKAGFVKKSEAIGMALNLADLQADLQLPSGLEIQVVADGKTLHDWARVVTLGLFKHPDADIIHFYELMSNLLEHNSLKFFVGYCEEQAVTSSTLFLSKGIAGIYHVATLPAFRNRGIGRCITLAPLLMARDIGIEVAILQATRLGEIVYKRLGFMEYSRLGRYWLDA